MARKKRSGGGGPSGQEWLTTYSDMVTLMLCFFVIFFNPDDASTAQMSQLAASVNTMGLGALAGGNTVSIGKQADLGNNIDALPSMEKGKMLGTALKKAVSLFTPDIRSNKVRVTHDERGLVITLAADAFFRPASARINIDETRDILLRLGNLLASPELLDSRGQPRKIRLEGHTDNEQVDANGPWEDNWDLSTARSRAILHYLTGIGVDEKRFQVAGFADTMPVAKSETREAQAYNRRVDVIILDEGHL
ncbi:MAG: flagellar motor protein MotB [Treponema sp.]|jgi:chemotaxis protein MotB|nr:flagellar motor protein MotB [Treponema sp.]